MYFDVSLIFPKSNDTRICLLSFLEKEYELIEGENLASKFGCTKIIVFSVEEEGAEYDEICIDFSEQVFHKETFKKEIDELTDFVHHCFKYNPNLKYVLCSYESNGYLLGGIKELKDFNSGLLKRFPLVYEKKEAFNQPSLQINEDAQDIFV